MFLRFFFFSSFSYFVGVNLLARIVSLFFFFFFFFVKKIFFHFQLTRGHQWKNVRYTTSSLRCFCWQQQKKKKDEADFEKELSKTITRKNREQHDSVGVFVYCVKSRSITVSLLFFQHHKTAVGWAFNDDGFQMFKCLLFLPVSYFFCF